MQKHSSITREGVKISYDISIHPPTHICNSSDFFPFFFSCDQVRPSVTPFSLCPHYDIIMKFSGVITNGRCEVHAKGQRSKVKFTEFQNPT